MPAAPNPDKAALARVGALVRERIADDPGVHPMHLEYAEVYAVSKFLSPEECDHLMAMIDDVAKPSTVYQEVHLDGYRTSYSGDVDPHDSFVIMIERRLGDLLGVDLGWGETIQGQRYEPGQEFKEHCDWFDTETGYWKEEVLRGGQRSWTAMVFLNDVEEGGCTVFPHLQMRIPPQRGALLFWNNSDRNGEPNNYTLHAARPVERGVKYVITKWYRTRQWR